MTFPILEPHRSTPTDWVVGLGLVIIFPVFLITPLTLGWKLIRGGIFAPLTASIFAYLGLYRAHDDLVDQWGAPNLMCWYFFRCWSLLLFWPPEENIYRLRPASQVHKLDAPKKQANGFHAQIPNGSAKIVQPSSDSVLVAEPIPPPWTWAKFYWASSLWWSWRCIGWSNSCPLPPTARAHPYTRQSSRKDYLVHRFKFFILTSLARDWLRAYVVFSKAAPFFQDVPGAKTYADMNSLERAHVSLAVVAWVWLGMEKSHVPASIIMVGLGGIFGWKGEIWEPWGWPPLFGGMRDFWTCPSLSHTWSRSWHQYFRSFFYQYGWLGIGETILGLPPSGPSVRSKVSEMHGSQSTGSSNSTTPTTTPGLTPAASGRASPSHPIPTSSSQSLRRLRLPTTLSNLIKSLIVCTLNGLVHDQSVYTLLKWYNYPGSPWLAATTKGSVVPGPNPYMKWTDAIITTPFFVMQPLALAVEAIVKRQWRAWKVRNHPEWFERKAHGVSNGTSNGVLNGIPNEASNGVAKPGTGHQAGGEPEWLIFLERLINFTFTWVWLGWSASYFVAGLPKTGALKRMTDQPDQFSPMGGLVWGKWYH